MMKIKLGDNVKDRITGFKGIALARAEYLAGCVRILIQPEGLDEKGEARESDWIDEGLVVLVKENGEKKAPATGGPANAPPMQQNDPIR